MFDLSPTSPQLDKLDADLCEARTLLGDAAAAADSPLRVGVSIITGHSSVSNFEATTLPILAKHRPAAVWLFAPAEDTDPNPHGAIIAAVRQELDGVRIFVQVGNVAAAREAARDGADVLVCQGVDAGGHQFTRGAGVVSLVPEVRAMLAAAAAEEEDEEFRGRGVAVLAAGGIADEKGVAAALALGK